MAVAVAEFCEITKDLSTPLESRMLITLGLFKIYVIVILEAFDFLCVSEVDRYRKLNKFQTWWF